MFVCISIETCITKVFVSPVANKALTNHVITSRKVTSAENCEIECFLEMKCESYNLGPQLENGDHVCELSNSDAIRGIVIFLEFHSTKQGLPLVDSWSRGLD